jgi:hypothetical protein
MRWSLFKWIGLLPIVPSGSPGLHQSQALLQGLQSALERYNNLTEGVACGLLEGQLGLQLRQSFLGIHGRIT